MHVLKEHSQEPTNENSNPEECLPHNPANIATFGKFYSTILLSPGEVVSLTNYPKPKRDIYGGLGMPQENCVVSCKFPIIYYVISLYF